MKAAVLCAALALASTRLATADEFRLGIAGPLTGPNAVFGDQLVRGTKLAVDDLNAKGGVLGATVTLDMGDDASDPKQGVSVANKFVGDGIKYVVGGFNSGVSIPESDVYHDNGIVMVTPASTSPKYTEQGYWDVFRTCGRDDQQAEVAARYIAANFAGKRIAVIDDKTTYGKGLATATTADLAAAGIKPVLRESVTAGEKDYSAVVTKIKQAGADLVYFAGAHPEAGLIRRQMADQRVTAPMMGGDGIASDEFASIAGPSAEGTLMTFPTDPRKLDSAKAVVASFKAHGIDPEAYTLNSYAAVQVLAAAAEAAKSTDPRKVAERMHSGMVFHTAIGDLAFDGKGDLTKANFVVHVWRKDPTGRIAAVEGDR